MMHFISIRYDIERLRPRSLQLLERRIGGWGLGLTLKFVVLPTLSLLSPVLDTPLSVGPL